MAYVPVIDEEKCRSCEECVENCTADVLEMKDGKPRVARPDSCQGCETCILGCEYDAIKLNRDNRQALSPTLASLFKNLPE